MILAPGLLVGGKYTLVAPLARGGMGSVWTATHEQLGVTVAIKFQDPGFTDPSYRRRFEREARAAAVIKSPHVVQVHDFGIEDDTPYIVMELLEGEDLGQRLKRERRIGLEATAQILVQLAKGLRRAHEAGIVHRDLKPGNVFLARADAHEELVKILDFGVAKAIKNDLEGEPTKTGEIVGTPHYMSPEQMRGDRDIDARADLWSVGVILFRILTGKQAFAGEQFGPVVASVLTAPPLKALDLVPELPEGIDTFFATAFEKDRDRRFQDIQALVDAFLEYTQVGASGLMLSSRGLSGPISIGRYVPVTAEPSSITRPSATAIRLSAGSEGVEESASAATTGATIATMAHTRPQGSKRRAGTWGLAAAGALALGLGLFWAVRSPSTHAVSAEVGPATVAVTTTGTLAAAPEPTTPLPTVGPAVTQAPPSASPDKSASLPARAAAPVATSSVARAAESPTAAARPRAPSITQPSAKVPSAAPPSASVPKWF
jgi:serine/threonine-protein kinase